MKNIKLKIIILIVVLAAMFGAYYYFNPAPEIVISDQPVQNGKFTFEKVYVRENSWLVLYSLKKNVVVEEVGKVFVEKGRNKEVGVFVNVSKTTPQIEATLYRDLGSLGVFDVASDTPIVIKDVPLKLVFNKL